MENKFEFAYAFTKQWEGVKFTNDPVDKGGATKFGITYSTLKGLPKSLLTQVGLPSNPEVEDLKALTAEQAQDIFHAEYWNLRNLDEFPKRVAAFLFDCNVNHGWKNAVKIAQRGYNKTLGVYGSKLTVDGSLGHNTKTALSHETDLLIESMIDAREAFYRQIVAGNASQKKFLTGWLNRVKAQREYLS